jgi:hypothetical protein
MPCLHAEGLQDALTKCHTSSRNFKSGECVVVCVEHADILAQITVVTISRMLRWSSVSSVIGLLMATSHAR